MPRAYLQRVVLLCSLTAATCAPQPAFAVELGAAKRMVSINLCADQMLMKLVDPNRIAALGPFAREPLLSFFADRAKQFPQVSNRTESLLNIDVDAVAVGPFDNMYLRAALRRQGLNEIVVGRWVSLSEVKQGVASFSKAINQPESGMRLIEEIQNSLDDLKGIAHGSPSTFLLLQRRGYVGEGEIVGELLEIAGLTNAAKGAPPQFMSVESVIALRPSLLVVSGRDVRAEDRGLELLEHPALKRLYPPTRRITAPDRLTICGGPSTPDLVRHLKSELLQWQAKQ